ncbi:MAG: class I SAM-dependent methyltransferase, partial [Oscillospiraceae bacterium]|nr:class I SAM-dependent methyltransferase [Oscillospiraceae bacterium]
FHVQDIAAQICCHALGPQPGESVLDLCAAPGGKSFTLAQLVGARGRVRAMELHPGRVHLIESGAKRLGLSNITAIQGDAVNADEILAKCGKSRKILCDVPCSGLGTIRKKPDIREKMRVDIDKLPKMQYDILNAASRCLVSGGTLLYSTCTLNPAENEEVCRRFLGEHPEFAAVEVLPGVPGFRREGEPFLTLMPHLSQSDGFFIAKFCLGEQA